MRDTWQPCPCQLGFQISLENRQAIQNFALALACEEKPFVNYIQHIKDMEIESRRGEEKGSSQSNK